MESSAQRSCAEPNREVGARRGTVASVCLYYDRCCPYDAWSGEGWLKDGHGVQRTKTGDEDENHARQGASEDGTRRIGLSFAFVMMAIAVLYFFAASFRDGDESAADDRRLFTQGRKSPKYRQEPNTEFQNEEDSCTSTV